MKVIAGAIEKPTPIFSDTLTTVVFAPYWNVPSSIAKEETIPAVMSDPEFLVRNNIEILSTSGEVIDPGTIDWSATVADSGLDPNTAEDDDGLFEAFPYRFRQRPGTANSLGLVKFLFPNAFDVYLHDTPATALFAKSYRALSHGCIRLEQPVKLAEYLLENHKTWNSSRIREAMDGGEEQAVALPHPIPVHLMYWTARVDDEGRVLFLDDIYGHDSRQWQEYESRISRVKARKDRLRAAGLSGPVAGTSVAAPGRAAGGGSLPRRVPPAGTASR
jgi:murein L,D-transpeptidase YcbB/YkuD